jgi:hypothetical protein
MGLDLSIFIKGLFCNQLKTDFQEMADFLLKK